MNNDMTPTAPADRDRHAGVATDSAVPIRISGPEGIVAAVPQLLGFVPQASLVLLCVSGPRMRLGPVVRADLPAPGESSGIDQLIACAARYADTAIVVCYHDADRPDCLDELLTALGGAKVPIAMTLSVSGGLIRDASSAAAHLDDPGSPVPGCDDGQYRTLAAAAALAGRQVLPNREALADSVAAPTGNRLTAARAAVRRARQTSPVGRETDGPGRAEAVDDAFGQALTNYRTTGTVALACAATLIVMASDIGCRDHLIARAVAHDDTEVVAMLIAVARLCPRGDDAEICAVLAVAAYRFGDGALAQCALDRTLTASPEHRLAHLLLSAMAAGLPPTDLLGMAGAVMPTAPRD